ncbi:hypothetical protein P775_23840 [Puniceibacterium antarcticum]|uniref:TonB C-terminal domain-containing protein n=1 Tax=Puniceibacterium antarcticum TaxID=1206336 RepID=A0A2G8R7V8_9RHOB|nr:TonB family protein [Puniceibacterium antarcticum]PIL17614.1 hypothetical protein P775_23840 [Puniceibacterium antarcticum]
MFPSRAAVLAMSATVASVVLHLGGLAYLFGGESAQTAGGAEVSVARLGNSFQDLVVGTMTATATEAAPLQHITAETATQSETPPEPSVQQHVPEAAKQVSADPSQPGTTPATNPVTQAAEMPAPEVSPQPAPESTVSPAATAETITAMAETYDAPRSSLRPAPRPEQITVATPPKPTMSKKPEKKAAQPKGNADRAAVAGSSGGTDQAPAATAAPRKAAASTAGNAAASNYPGQVLRRIEQVRQDRNPRSGEAMVAFSITSGGGLGAVSIAQSSGSDKLDRAALGVLQRAAPFPPPPAGAQSRFTVRVRLK